MKRCDDCRYRNEPEYNKPCVVYRADCPLYEKEGDGMINEEAIKELSEMRTDAWTDSRQMEALEMAIKALEQEPSGDLISREAVNEIINDIRDCISVEGYCAILERLKKLPSVNPQEPKTDVLDEIRAEIKQLPYQRIFGKVSNYSLLDVVIEIIDKYKAESEDEALEELKEKNTK